MKFDNFLKMSTVLLLSSLVGCASRKLLVVDDADNCVKGAIISITPDGGMFESDRLFYETNKHGEVEFPGDFSVIRIAKKGFYPCLERNGEYTKSYTYSDTKDVYVVKLVRLPEKPCIRVTDYDANNEFFMFGRTYFYGNYVQLQLLRKWIDYFLWLQTNYPELYFEKQDGVISH